jgi:hypothetical protein
MEQAADNRFRLAAIGHLQRVATDGVVTADDLRAGFIVDGQRIPLINPQRGIFKPTVMRYLLSIMPDVHEELGQPVVSNGLPMSKIHHAAFDSNLIGIDPDFRIHVSEELLAMNDGPMLEQGIKAMAGRIIRLPNREVDHPDRDRLAQRFELFAQRG